MDTRAILLMLTSAFVFYSTEVLHWFVLASCPVLRLGAQDCPLVAAGAALGLLGGLLLPGAALAVVWTTDGSAWPSWALEGGLVVVFLGLQGWVLPRVWARLVRVVWRGILDRSGLRDSAEPGSLDVLAIRGVVLEPSGGNWLSAWVDHRAQVHTPVLARLIRDAEDPRPGARARGRAMLNLLGPGDTVSAHYWEGYLAAAQASLQGNVEQTLVRERALLAWSQAPARIHFLDGFLSAVRWMEVSQCA